MAHTVMTIYELFERATELGIAHDFRPRREVVGYEFCETIHNGAGRTFVNPYPDSGVVWVKDLNVPVKLAAVGLEISQEELLVVREWEKRSKGTVDLFISHHSRGRPLRNFSRILKTQLGNLASQGVEVSGLEQHFDQRVREMEISALASNYHRTRDSAALLHCNYLALHTPTDNLAARFVQQILRDAGARTLGHALESLRQIPEYQIAEREDSFQPLLLAGAPDDELGHCVLTEFTGGEEGPLQVYRAMKASGVDTIVVMHLSDEALAEAKRRKLKVIAAGHVSSDSIGLNLLADELEKEGVEILPLAGFIRHSRTSGPRP